MPWPRALTCALTLLLAACGNSGLQGGGSAPPGNGGGGGSNPPSATAQPRDCFWALRSDANVANVLYPDRYATYWVAALAIPPGGHIRLDGRYPHARYASFNLYNPRLEPLDALADVEIAPNPGSTQPFAAGVNREAAARDYSVRIVSAVRPDDPAAREPNTLYSFQALGAQRVPSPLAIVIYRLYVQDNGQDLTGGVGLPTVNVVTATGQTLSGSAACSALEALQPPDLTSALNALPLAAVGANTSAFKHLQWLKFFDLVSAQANRFNATPLGPVVAGALGQSTNNAGGFASNVHNNYVYAALAQSLGTVVAVAGTAPITPRTQSGQTRMEPGQMRYFSFCTNEANSTRYFACVFDEQVTRDASNRYVLAVSRAADRPANARAECGVTWLEFGPLGQSLLIYRHMLPAAEADFPQAIQYIPGPAGSAEESTMGRYFPYGMHSDIAAFEALGCPINPDAIPQRTAEN